VRPLIIQNARQDARCRKIPAAQLGLTRYLGVPVHDNTGKPIGTLCFLDGRSEVTLDAEDVRFLSLLAMRVSVEMERERIMQERLAEQQAVLLKQQADLSVTHHVLNAMNTAFRMMGERLETQSLLDEQLKLLQGSLGYEGAAILLCDADGERLSGRYVTFRQIPPRSVEISLRSDSALKRLCGERSARSRSHHSNVCVDARSTRRLSDLLNCRFAVVAPLRPHDRTIALLALGSQTPPPLDDLHHRTHLEALIDQVALLINSHLLQNQLVQAHNELRRAQQQLIQSEKLSAVGTLAASIAHDIRNIITPLNLQLATYGGLSEEGIVASRQQLSRLSVLAHRLLAFSRPSQLEKEKVDVTSVLADALTLVGPQADVARVKITCHNILRPFIVAADPSQLEQLFINLALNAIHAMSPQGGTLTVRASSRNGWVKVDVQDTGCGIPPERLGDVFKPFFTTRRQGTGLGLFSCQRIVADHDGKITVRSEVGKGACFSVWLPKCK
jgi:signal transduction histidine kinase